MATNQTANYQLNQWEPTDAVQRTDFNTDNAKVDAALDALAGQVAEKADGADLTALEATVAGHTTQLGQLGNCRIEHFTYVGNGLEDQQSTRTVSFSAAPLCYLIIGPDAIGSGARSNNYIFVSYYMGNVTMTVTWTGTQFTFVSGRRDAGLNVKGSTYHVIAFYTKEAA